MRIALVNTIKPVKGSGNGVVEYAYQLYEYFKRSNDVDFIYAIDSPKRNDLPGLVYTNTLFRSKVKRLLKEDYDIIHIMDHEIGFVAKMLHGHTNAKVLTTVHDLARFDKGIHKGVLQKSYNRIVKRNIKLALEFSDAVMFNSSQTMEDVKNMFGLPKKYRVINHGVKDSVLKNKFAKDKQSKRDNLFKIGYIGALAYHKNVIMILKTAEIIKDRNNYKFIVYGTGIEYKTLLDYKNRHGLENVEFMGFAPERKIAQIYNSFDAFVCPSLYEGFGLPILEAQARGLPVIIYRHSKIPKEVRRYCLEADDAEDMARIIKDLKENGYGKRLKNKATRYARSFTCERTAEETLKVYNDMLKA